MTDLKLVHSAEPAAPNALNLMASAAAAAAPVQMPAWEAMQPHEREAWRAIVRAVLLAYQEAPADIVTVVRSFLPRDMDYTCWRLGHVAAIDYVAGLK